MHTRILIVEDDTYVLDNNREFLQGRGYQTFEAETLTAARGILADNAVDLVVLDVNLPDGSGFDLADEIPKRIPILYLTARTTEEDVVQGLSRSSGGVDYLRKPFGYAEMGARVAALLNAAQQASLAPTLLRGRLSLDVVSGRAFWGTEDLGLAQKQFALLYALLQNEGKALSSEALYTAAWNQPMSGDGNALWTQMSRLRKKLEAYPSIELTASRVDGYTLTILD